MEDKGEWCKAEWEPAAECVMVDLFFNTAPPENQSVHFALGISETKDLIKSLRNAVAQSECGAV